MALVNAADSKEIPLSRDEALQRFNNLIAQVGITTTTAENAGTPSQAATDESMVPAGDLYDYYNDEGPPVITYYEPPPAI
ncbi:MAG: hypothetical protein ABSA18_18005 [Dehalococcoidia bacterium]|jgi:hypothetical protein